MYAIDLLNVIFRSAFAHDTGSTSGFMVWGPSIITRGHILVFLLGKENGVRYIIHVASPVLLSFRRQEGDVLFQQYNARSHGLL